MDPRTIASLRATKVGLPPWSPRMELLALLVFASIFVGARLWDGIPALGRYRRRWDGIAPSFVGTVTPPAV